MKTRVQIPGMIVTSALVVCDLGFRAYGASTRLSTNAGLLPTADVFFACLGHSNELVPYDLTPPREFDTDQALHEDFRQGGQSLSQNLDRVTIELIGRMECR
jgi:hypothetical protein